MVFWYSVPVNFKRNSIKFCSSAKHFVLLIYIYYLHMYAQASSLMNALDSNEPSNGKCNILILTYIKKHVG